MSQTPPRVAAFRPADGRAAAARDRLEALGADPVIDPMLELVTTGEAPRTDADYVVLTSPAAAEIVADLSWEPGGARVCAIGDRTAAALEASGIDVDVVPETYTSRGLVETLADRIEGADIEVARSDHGTPDLLAGLRDAGATVNETVLYRLRRPENAGESAELVARGKLDAVLFTSALTVEHFLEAASDRGIEPVVREGLSDIAVGAIGAPTAEAAQESGIEVDVVPSTVSFDRLATEVVTALTE